MILCPFCGTLPLGYPRGGAGGTRACECNMLRGFNAPIHGRGRDGTAWVVGHYPFQVEFRPVEAGLDGRLILRDGGSLPSWREIVRPDDLEHLIPATLLARVLGS